MGIIGALSSGTGSSAADRRQLAVDLFNEVWTLIETPDRSSEDDDRMLHAAHASRFHWGEVGAGVNLARGEWQCARVYSVLGRAEPALHHARRCLELCTRHEVEDFDLPYAHELCGRAVILDGGRIVADGPTDEVLGDAALLAAHDLELPHGFVMDHH